MLLKFPILRQSYHKKPFNIYTDASGYALGALLSQFDGDSNEYVCHNLMVNLMNTLSNGKNLKPMKIFGSPNHHLIHLTLSTSIGNKYTQRNQSTNCICLNLRRMC
jgi:hypothetical protein